MTDELQISPRDAASGKAESGERAALSGAAGQAAQRALAEAQERRLKVTPPPRELHGRDGLDPVRYGDWEVNGLASDF